MPIPILPAVMFALASTGLILGQFLRSRGRAIPSLLSVAAVLFAVYHLSTASLQNSVPPNTAIVHAVWNDDALARSEQWLILLFGLLSGISFLDWSRKLDAAQNPHGFLLFAVAGLMLVAQSNDLLALGLAVEIVSLAVIAIGNRAESQTANGSAQNWLLRLASGLMWLGIALLANATASTRFDLIQMILTKAYDPGFNQSPIGAPSKMIVLAMGLIAFSLFARMGLVPFHLKFQPRPLDRFGPFNGFSILSGQLAGTIGLTRLFGTVFVGFDRSLIILTMTLCLATFALSAGMAIRGLAPGMKSIPRWVMSVTLLQSAWLGTGMMFVASELENPKMRLGAFPHQNETAALCVFAQLATILASGGIYWALGYLKRANRDVEFIEDFKGLGQINPLASFALIASLASLIACPLTAGFWSRWFIFVAGHHVHHKFQSNIFTPDDGLRFLMLTGVVATLPMIVVVIRLAQEMFLESPLARSDAIGGRSSLVAGVIAAIASLVLGFTPQFAINLMQINQSLRMIAPADPELGSGRNSLGLGNEREPAKPDLLVGLPQL